jgi:prepilin-type N-terminal cleavage/methylation domain-containing protein
MKKLGKSTKKGFTLVELIVVLVILAVLAAMLVPALVGYIDRARAEKEYQTAATVYGAAQAVITELYAKDKLPDDGKITTGQKLDSMPDADAVIALAGVPTSITYSFTFDADTHIIDGGDDCWVKIGDATYTLTIDDEGVPSWSAELD